MKKREEDREGEGEMEREGEKGKREREAKRIEHNDCNSKFCADNNVISHKSYRILMFACRKIAYNYTNTINM